MAERSRRLQNSLPLLVGVLKEVPVHGRSGQKNGHPLEMISWRASYASQEQRQSSGTVRISKDLDYIMKEDVLFSKALWTRGNRRYLLLI